MEDNEFEIEEGSRNAAQKLAMTAIYDALTYLDMGEAVDIERIVSSLCDCDYEDADYFVKASLIYAMKNIAEFTELLNSKMNRWTFARRNRVEQAIFLLSLAHYRFVDPTVDKAIVIDIAIKLAKTYLQDNDYKFVNAVLDKALTR